MADEENVDTGNPDVFTIFEGQYDIALAGNCSMDNASTMLTIMCVVCIMSDAVLTGYTDGETFATLASECCPDEPIKLPVFFDDSVVALGIGTDGAMTATGASGDGTLHLEGLCFNNCDRWY